MICDTVTGHISFVFKLLPSKSEDSSFSFPLDTENKIPFLYQTWFCRVLERVKLHVLRFQSA